MKNLTQNSKYIWVMLGLGLSIRLLIYFFNVTAYEANPLRVIAMACDLAIGFVVYRLAIDALRERVTMDSSTPPGEIDAEAQSVSYADGSELGDPTPASSNLRLGWPLAVAAFWIFNPAAIFVSSALGIPEPLLVLLLVLLLALFRGSMYSALLVLLLPVAFQLRGWFGAASYGSVGAFNFFALIGGIGRPLDTFFLGFVYYVWGAALTLIIVAGAAVVIYTDYQRGGKNYFLIIGAYFMLIFVFSAGMHAHALFPGLVFLLLHFIERRDGRVLGLYLAFSVTLLINAYQMRGFGWEWFHFSHDFMLLASVANVLLGVVLVYVVVNTVWPKFRLLASPDNGGIPAKYYVWILLALGLWVRVLAVVHIDYSFSFDVGLFKSWGIFIHEHGFAAYYNYGYRYLPMTDYPPVYLYVLYLIARLRAYFDWDRGSIIFNFLIFLPAILCDLGIGYVLHRRAQKSQRATSRFHIPALLAAFWMFNPAIILISSVWGQVESVFVLLLLLSLLLLRDKKLLPAYLLYAVAILTKPQSLFLAPVYLFSAIEHVQKPWNMQKPWDVQMHGSGQEKKFHWERLVQLGCYILVSVGLMIVIFLPFDLFVALEFFRDGLGLRTYGTVNAFNFYGLIGANWRPLNYRFAGISYGFLGMAVVITLIIGTIIALYTDRKRGGDSYFLIVGGLLALIYIFAFRMLDRYMFPAIPFLLLGAIEKRDGRVLGIYAGISVTFFFNCFEILRWVRHQEIRPDVVRAVSAGNVILGCFLLYVIISSVWGKRPRTALPVLSNDESPSSMRKDLP